MQLSCKKLDEIWSVCCNFCFFFPSSPAWLLVSKQWRTRISVTRSWSSSSRTTATYLRPPQMEEAAQKNCRPLLLSRCCILRGTPDANVYMKWICAGGQHNVMQLVRQLLWVTCSVHALETVWVLLWPTTSPCAHLLEEQQLKITGLYNVKLKLIQLLILYHSLTGKTPPQVAVLGLWMLIYICCFDGWCLYWLASLTGLLVFLAASCCCICS